MGYTHSSRCRPIYLHRTLPNASYKQDSFSHFNVSAIMLLKKIMIKGPRTYIDRYCEMFGWLEDSICTSFFVLWRGLQDVTVGSIVMVNEGTTLLGRPSTFCLRIKLQNSSPTITSPNNFTCASNCSALLVVNRTIIILFFWFLWLIALLLSR